MALRLAIPLLALLVAAPVVASEPAQPEGAVPPEAVIGIVPFEPHGLSNRVFVNLAPEGNRPLVWLLDTGAQGSVMTPLAARAAGVSVRRTKSSPYVRKTRLGRNVQFWVDTRRSDTGSRTGAEYGVLGGDFLEEYVVEIDFPNRVVRFLDPKRYEVPKTVRGDRERVLPMRVNARRPFVEVEIGEETTQVLIDTGVPFNLMLSGRSVRKLGIDWKSLPGFGRLGLAAGPVEVRIHESDVFRFAGFQFGTTPILVAPKGAYNWGGNTDSVLGVDVLRQFVVRLDYPRERIWLERTGDPTVTYLGADYSLVRLSGAYIGWTVSGYIVGGVASESPAARIGLRSGDVPVKGAGEGPFDFAKFISRVASGEEVSVARQQGKVWVDVVLPEVEFETERPAGSEPRTQ